MKKNLFLFAAAAVALGLASCSSDETIESAALSETNEISFRPVLNGATRAADITTANLTSFNVTAYPTGTTTTAYMNNVPFTKSGETYTSATKYYWPSSALDFYAYAPTDGTGITPTAYNSFTVTPSTTITSQADLVFAKTVNKTKTTTGGVAGAIALNFRHAGSKIVVKVKNSEPNLKFEVSAIKIVNVDGTATFTCADANTDGQNTEEAVSGTTLASSDWSNNTEASEKNTTYTTGGFTAANVIPASQTTAMFLNHSSNSPSTSATDEDINMILIPQTTSAATAYSATTENAAISTGSYIAVKMVIKNNLDGTTIADATQDVSTVNKWAIWPVAFNWAPGKKYTYTIDLGDGGYWELNTNDGDTDLDPILEGAVIKFVSVTVDEWDATTYAVPQVSVARAASYAFSNGGTQTINLSAGANGTYTITITGLTNDHTVTAAASGATNNFTVTGGTSSTVAGNKVTITGTLAANTTAAATSDITITDTDATESMTVSIVQAAP